MNEHLEIFTLTEVTRANVIFLQFEKCSGDMFSYMKPVRFVPASHSLYVSIVFSVVKLIHPVINQFS